MAKMIEVNASHAAYVVRATETAKINSASE
jgi:hypothetical protein